MTVTTTTRGCGAGDCTSATPAKPQARACAQSEERMRACARQQTTGSYRGCCCCHCHCRRRVVVLVTAPTSRCRSARCLPPPQRRSRRRRAARDETPPREKQRNSVNSVNTVPVNNTKKNNTSAEDTAAGLKPATSTLNNCRPDTTARQGSRHFYIKSLLYEQGALQWRRRRARRHEKENGQIHARHRRQRRDASNNTTARTP